MTLSAFSVYHFFDLFNYFRFLTLPNVFNDINFCCILSLGDSGLSFTNF